MKNIIIFIFGIYSFSAFAQDVKMHINGTPVYRQHIEVAVTDQQQSLTLVKTSGEALRDYFYEEERNNPSIWGNIWQLLPAPSTLDKWTETPCSNSQAIQVCLLMDITGSMAQELKALQQFWPKFGNALTQQYIVDQAQVHFRDEAATEALTREAFGQATDLSAVYLSLVRAGGGGDDPERWPVALAQAIDSLTWSADAAGRFIFFVVDAAPQYEEETAAQLQQLLAKAQNKNLHVVPIAGVNVDTELKYLLKSMAIVTKGFYLEIEASEGETDISALVEEVDVRIAPICEFEEASASLKCFPNPAREYTYIALPISEGAIQVTDASGKMVHQQTFEQGGQLKLDISDWATGIYSIEVRNQGRQFTGRFVRQ